MPSDVPSPERTLTHLTNTHGTSGAYSAPATDVEKPQGRAAVAALLGRAPYLGSLHRNAFSRDIAGYLELKVAGRVVKIQGEGTGVRIAAIPQSHRFTEVDGSHEVSVRVVRPHAMSELESPVRTVFPHARQTAMVFAFAQLKRKQETLDAADLVDATHYENHPWAEGGDVAVVVLQDGDGGVVRGGDR